MNCVSLTRAAAFRVFAWRMSAHEILTLNAVVLEHGFINSCGKPEGRYP